MTTQYLKLRLEYKRNIVDSYTFNKMNYLHLDYVFNLMPFYTSILFELGTGRRCVAFSPVNLRHMRRFS